MADERQALADPEPRFTADTDLPVEAPPRPGGHRSWIRVGAVAVMLAAAVAVPLFGPTDSTLLLLANVAMYTALGANWNLISGYTGYIDFGHAVFFGIGGYVTAILLVRYEVPLWATFPIAMAVAAAFALLIGIPLLRVRGVYFSIAMLGAFLGTREIAGLLPITGGGSGLTIPPWTDPDGRMYFYYAFLAMAVLGVALLAFVRRSQLGSCLLAVREDEEGAAARGVNTTAVKVTAFVVAGSLTAVVGALWAYQNTFVDPFILFRDELLLYLALVVLVGGLGTVWGPLVGAVTVVLIRDGLAQNFVQWHLLILGLFLIAIVLLMPEGIVGSGPNRVRALIRRHFRRVTKQLAPSSPRGDAR